jgi:hypothetical protein
MAGIQRSLVWNSTSTNIELFRYLGSTLLDDAASSAQRISVEAIHTIEEALELSEKHS